MTRWITDYIGTSAFNEATAQPDIHLLDVRDLVDKSGNEPSAINSKIDEALSHLLQGQKVVICCDYGVSRSNAIAAGVIARYDQIGLNQAVRQVLKTTGENSIKIEVLSAVRQALESETKKYSPTSLAGTPKRLLITGSSGFLGTTLAAHLDNLETFRPTRSEINLMSDVVKLDLLVKEKNIDTVIHLANPRVYSTNESMGQALIMLKNVLDVCSENQLWLIFLSGWEIYSGYKTEELRANEALPPHPGSTYGQTKFLCETLIDLFHRNNGLRYTILRSSPVYGTESDRPRFIWNFLNKALRNEEIVTHKYLNGFPKLDLLHVSDLCRSVAQVIKLGAQGTFNLGTGVGTSTAEVARYIIELCGSHSKLQHIKVDNYASNIVMDNSRARSTLGWEPIIDFPSGLKMLVEEKCHAR
ncbi:MAG: NAD-dependent epimerase/dehydratase family protein [Bacillota bacterium]